MIHPLDPLRNSFSPSGEIARDAWAFLEGHGFPKIARHSQQVAEEAARLASRYGGDVAAATTAGWLHDISVVFPNDQRVRVAQGLGIPTLPEELAHPVLLHQKISAEMARELFNIHNPQILSAVGCHTTLKAQASRLDEILFVADKLQWDQPGEPPYLSTMLRALEESLEAAALVYIHYLVENKDRLSGPLHPWLLAAQTDLESIKDDGGDIIIREAAVEDALAIAHVRVQSWRTTYTGLISSDYLERLDETSISQHWQHILSNPAGYGYTYVAQKPAGEIIGFVIGGRERALSENYPGEIYAIYILQEYQGQGIGKQLVRAITQRLLDEGLDKMLIWVLDTNPARGFYENLGGIFVQEKDVYIGSEKLREVSYGFSNLRDLAGKP